jgi:OFA family oxalate/formate antiporter-like MFS transporter
MYFASLLCGIGIAGVYGGTIGNSLKWFGDRRGLAVGLTASGYGAGSAMTITPIDRMLRSQGYRQTFLIWGIIQGCGILLFGVFLRTPTKQEEDLVSAAGKIKKAAVKEKTGCDLVIQKIRKCGPGVPMQKSEDYTLLQVVKLPLFWIMYACFIFAAIPGLIATAQLAPFAKEYDIPENILTLALTVDRILNGMSRPISGWVSDSIGREELLFLAFIVEGLGFLFLWLWGASWTAFIIVTGMLFFAYGEMFSLFPASLADTFGRKHVTSVYGMMYTAKGVGSLLIPVADVIWEWDGSWKPVIIICYAFSFAAALLIVVFVRPIKGRFIRAIKEKHGVTAEAEDDDDEGYH